MDDKCPRCGAEHKETIKIKGATPVNVFDCGSQFMLDGCYLEYMQCLRNQLVQANAKIAEKDAENTRLRAALAHSELPCVYCSLSIKDWAKCESGFPSCARSDDAMGCPHLADGIALAERDAENERLKTIASLAAEYHAEHNYDGSPQKRGCGCSICLAYVEAAK